MRPVTFLLVFCLGCGTKPGQQGVGAAHKGEAIQFTAVQMYREFKEDKEKFLKKVGDNRVFVTGVVDYTVILSPGVLMFMRHSENRNYRQDKIIAGFSFDPPYDQGFDVKMNNGFSVPWLDGDTITLSGKIVVKEDGSIAIRMPKLETGLSR